MEKAQSVRARFGSFELDLRAGELHVIGDGQPTLLPVQVFQILQILIEHSGDVATREEIKAKLWPNDTIVEFDHSINAAIKKLRKALDDSSDDPKYIETIPRRGYRLMVPVEWTEAVDSAISSLSSRADPEHTRGGGEGPALDSVEEALPKAKLKVGRLTGKVVSHYRVWEVIGGGGRAKPCDEPLR
jgi:DNA-binding winged helix-turn-helix (wHTH) protein